MIGTHYNTDNIHTTSRKRKALRMKQRLGGLFIALASIGVGLLTADFTFAVLAVPFGIYLMRTKRIVMD